MISFKTYFESIRNPLRRQALKDAGINPNFTSKEDLEQQGDDYIDFIKHGTFGPEDEKIKDIHDQYERLKKALPPRAEKYLQGKKEELMTSIKKPTVSKNSIKIYEQGGVQVFADEYVQDQDYSVGSYNFTIIKRNVLKLLAFTKDIIPNKKPRIIITDISKNPATRAASSSIVPSGGMEYNGMIYIDKHSIDNEDVWIHEYAHWIVGMAPRDVGQLVIKAYNRVLNLYYRKVRKKKLRLEPASINSSSDIEMAKANRIKISEKLGFPDEYGLTNEHELFAIIIENWKKMKNTPATYRFKQMVKPILNRL